MKNDRFKPNKDILKDKIRIDKVLQELYESEEIHQLLFEHITQGFALHEIILNELEQPIDYRYLTVNSTFERLTGIKADDIVGKRVLEILPHTKPYWIETFGKVALSGESIQYENHSAEMGKSFETYVFSPRKGQFAVIFSEISDRKQEEKKIKQQLLSIKSPLNQNVTFEFTDLFNLVEIQKLQDQFAKAMGVASIITKPDGTPITQPSNFSNFCLLIRSTKNGAKNCHYSDRIIGRKNTEGPIIQKCLSSGLWDAGSSITVNGNHIASWLIGQVKSASDDNASIENYAHLIGVDGRNLLNAYEEVTQMTEEKFQSIAQVLFTFAGQLSTVAYQNMEQANLIIDLKQTKEELNKKNNDLQTAEEEIRASNLELKTTNDALLTNLCELQSAEEEIRSTSEELAATNDALLENIKELQSAEKEIKAANDKLVAMNDALDQNMKELGAAKAKVDEKELWLRESQRIGKIGTYDMNIKTGKWKSSQMLDEIFGIDDTYNKDIAGWFSLIHPEHSDEMLHYFEHDVIINRQTFDKQYKTIRKNDGSVRWLWGCGELILDQEENPIQMIGTIQDITEQKEAKLALKESAEFNRSLLQTIPYGIDVVDENGTILFLNEILSNSVSKDALGKKCYTIYSDKKTQCKGCPLKRKIKVGETAIIESPELMNGRIFQISHTGMMFQGKKAVLEIFQDVTESANAQEDIIIKNAELQLAEEEIRIANEELISANIDLHQRMKELKQAKDRAEESQKNLLIVNQEFEVLNQKLKSTNLELQIAKENAEEADRLKTSFLNNISHEIRTPLNAIVGFTDLISNRDYPKDQTLEFTKIIQQGSEQLTSVITDIINIATIEAGQLKKFEKRTDINTLISNLFSQFTLKVTKKEINLTYSQLIGVNPIIMADETKITQILSNLIGNAIKFTKKGTINYGCQLMNGYLQFYVKDEGIGIPPDLHEKIFERFLQIKTTMNREYGGNGLGLSIAKAYVELLGGEIWIKSEPGKGSIFYFTIPYTPILD